MLTLSAFRRLGWLGFVVSSSSTFLLLFMIKIPLKEGSTRNQNAWGTGQAEPPPKNAYDTTVFFCFIFDFLIFSGSVTA